MLAHNCTPHSKTGVSPYLALYGRDPPLPKFSNLDRGPLQNLSAREYTAQLQTRIDHVHNTVRSNTEAKVAKEKEAYDRKVKHSPYEPGDKVYEKKR